MNCVRSAPSNDVVDADNKEGPRASAVSGIDKSCIGLLVSALFDGDCDALEIHILVPENATNTETAINAVAAIVANEMCR